MDESSPNKAAVSPTLAAIDLLSKFAGCLAVVSAIAYVLGWQIASSYYAEFGATWLVSDLRTSELLGYIGPMAVGLTFWIFYFLQGVTERGYTPRGIEMAGAIGVCLACAGDLTNSLAFDYKYGWLEGLSQLALTFGLAAWLVGLWQRTLLSNGWSGKHWSLVTSIGMIIIVLLPNYLGRARALVDRDPLRSSLPNVTIQGATNENWKLLRSSGTDFVVFRKIPDQQFPEIRVVASSLVTRLQAPSANDKPIGAAPAIR